MKKFFRIRVCYKLGSFNGRAYAALWPKGHFLFLFRWVITRPEMYEYMNGKSVWILRSQIGRGTVSLLKLERRRYQKPMYIWSDEYAAAQWNVIRAAGSLRRA